MTYGTNSKNKIHRRLYESTDLLRDVGSNLSNRREFEHAFHSYMVYSCIIIVLRSRSSATMGLHAQHGLRADWSTTVANGWSREMDWRRSNDEKSQRKIVEPLDEEKNQ
ncbi:hypothetical protein DICVIV_09091 [Dictyocaulus viviparus]|uniref:Uncharacterized protein n=1 Tax=Dictyocaulus viviparus TaxID=29172 RepID=A0A0D8XM46_DICVI|nr:hypothetical protein DICVIV_09091 [Dictyocaulus viviparus]